jgi:hypothetical protein
MSQLPYRGYPAKISEIEVWKDDTDKVALRNNDTDQQRSIMAYSSFELRATARDRWLQWLT